jgi:hypothetical protein
MTRKAARLTVYVKLRDNSVEVGSGRTGQRRILAGGRSSPQTAPLRK